MSEIADRYRGNAQAFTQRVAAVPEGRWGHPSPCEGWAARDVVRHLVDVHGHFLGNVGRHLPADVPSVDDDPAGAWEMARDAVQADLDDPQRAAEEYDGYFGRTTFAASVDQFLSADLLIHSWDLARATGGDERLDQGEVERVFRELQAFGDAIRAPGAFGPEVAAPEDADPQERLLAYLGRNPRAVP